MFSQNDLTQKYQLREEHCCKKNISVSFCSSTIKALDRGYHRIFVLKDEVCRLLIFLGASASLKWFRWIWDPIFLASGINNDTLIPIVLKKLDHLRRRKKLICLRKTIYLSRTIVIRKSLGCNWNLVVR